ncbi:pantoate--beta-alanine ligase [Occultella kanbiaonis]|uniref:pantoate--beta-alanine ligase n=1 Tax=Occultella kanbiaonis TaxID=2675754 RepID=UPI0012B771CC
MTSRPGRLGVGVVGAGRVGTVLASALRSVGHAVVGASGGSEDTLDRIDALLPGVPVLEVEAVVERSELLLLTVPDDVLADLVSGLAALGAFQPGQLVVHTAGRYGTGVLAPARAAGAIPLAIHPAMTFTGTSLDLSRIVGAPFAVTAAPPVLPIAQALVVEIGGEPVVLGEDVRGLYHAALAHGANHLVTLTAQAIRLLAAAGVEDGGQLLTPLLQAALDGALRGGEASLTGPVVRGDVGTVREHLAALAEADGGGHGLLDVAPTYVALARATVQRALVNGRIGEARAGELLDALAATPGAAATTTASDAPTATASDAPTATASDAAVASSAVAGVAGGTSDGEAPEDLDDGSTGPLVVHTVAELRALRPRGTRAVVMTMGALHAGHIALVRAARRRADEVVVTIFVNPLQFSSAADLETYPRTLDTDVALLRDEGVDVVFAPSVDEMYPGAEPQVRIVAGRMGEILEGEHRPGHFDGMLTVVHKLLNLTAGDVALFGQKDAQQLALVRRMVADLNMGIAVVAVPTVRDPDGLALSSRNVHLSATDRAAALVLSRTVRAGARAAEQGRPPAEVLGAARAELATVAPAEVRTDYLELVDPVTMSPYPDAGGAGDALLVIAAHVGTTRLIDNAVVSWPDPRHR